MGRVTLYAPNGDVIDLDALKVVQAEVTTTSVRQVVPEHPSWGLSPEGLATILRQSEGADPSRWYALCADVEEKEWHYRGVLSQRRSALSQLPITVDPASDAKEHVAHADVIRSIMQRPEMVLSLFDLSDALGKGMAFGEIDWDTSAGQWMPKDIVAKPLAWFRYAQHDLTTPQLLDEAGMPQSLRPYKWITHRARLNSGLPVRDGLTRAAVWAWMFKNFDIKAWLVFLNRYGQPLRLGKYPMSSKPGERSTLLRALRDMGSDFAAIIPEGMDVEFVDGSGDGGAAFKDQAVYFDEQISKLTVGQTGTSDASKGGYAVGRVHEGVLGAICSYDGIVMGTSLNRDLVRPVIDLNFGPQKAYPTVKIGLPDQKNIELILKSIGDMIDRGLPVEASQVYPLLGLTEPAKPTNGNSVVLLKPLARSTPDKTGEPPPPGPRARADARPGGGGGPANDDDDEEEIAAAAENVPPAGDSFDHATAQILADEGWKPDCTELEEALAKCTTAEEGRAVLAAHLDSLGTDKLAAMLARARFAAGLAGDVSAQDA